MINRSVLVFATTCVAGSLCSAADLPARKPGLWQITMNTGRPNAPSPVEKVCLDKATDQLLYKAGAGVTAKMCSKVDIHSSGSQVTVESVCDIGSSKMSSRSVTTMSGDTAYHTDIVTHYDPPMFGKSDSASTQDAHWLGACPADMKPGDVSVIPDARAPMPMKMNLNDMFKAAGQ